MREKLIIGGAAVVVLLGLGWLLGGSPFVTVSKGYVGVKTRFGKVVGDQLNPGLQWKTPFIESVKQINIQQDNAKEHSQAASNDLQKVDTDVKVLYSLSPSLVPTAYDRIGDRQAIEDKIISPAIKETFKSVNAHHTAEELITKRSEVSLQIFDNLQTYIDKSCSSEGLSGLIKIDNVAIEDFRFSAQFDNSIEAKVTAEQEALRAKEEKMRTITEAEAQKEKVRLESEAVALRIENEAKAEATKIEMVSTAKADAIRREAEALTGNPDLIRLRQIEQWNGILPKFTSGSDMGFLMEMPSE